MPLKKAFIQYQCKIINSPTEGGRIIISIVVYAD